MFRRRWVFCVVVCCLVWLPSSFAQEQDVPGPQLCVGEEPDFTPASGIDFQIEEGNVVTATARYVNRLDQVFELTITATDMDVLNQYLYNEEMSDALFCFEVVSAEYVPQLGEGVLPDEAITGETAAEILPRETVDIALGDIFMEELLARLDEIGIPRAELLDIYATAVAAGDVRTLADFLSNYDIDPQELYARADERVNEELGAAVADGLSERRAQEVLVSIEIMYNDFLYGEDGAWLEDIEGEQSAPSIVIVEFDFVNTDDMEFPQGYLIVVAIDPSISYGQFHPYTVPSARWISTVVRAITNSVRSRLYYGSSCGDRAAYLWSATVNQGGKAESGWFWGNRQCVKGLSSPNSYYTLRGTWWVN